MSAYGGGNLLGPPVTDRFETAHDCGGTLTVVRYADGAVIGYCQGSNPCDASGKNLFAWVSASEEGAR